MYRKLYEFICENGKLEFERTKSKEEIVKTIQGLLTLGQRLGHDDVPSDEMIQYFEKEFDIENIVEFLNGIRSTNMWGDRRHDPKYYEKDLPLASEEVLGQMSENVLKWGNGKFSKESSSYKK